MNAHVSVTTEAQALVDGWPTCPAVTFGWDEHDPAVVAVTIDQSKDLPDCAPLTWLIGRDLMAAGVTAARPIGDGDVRVKARISPITPAASSFVMRLTNEGRVAHMVMPLAPVQWLVSEAERIVPVGSQDETDIINAELEVFLASLRDAA